MGTRHMQEHVILPRHSDFLNDVSIRLIDKTDPGHPTKHEDYWIDTLKTKAPMRLNFDFDGCTSANIFGKKDCFGLGYKWNSKNKVIKWSSSFYYSWSWPVGINPWRSVSWHWQKWISSSILLRYLICIVADWNCVVVYCIVVDWKQFLKELKFLSSVKLFTLKCFQGFYYIQWQYFFSLAKPPFGLSTPLSHFVLMPYVIVHYQD